MKTKIKNVFFYLLVALAVAGFGAQVLAGSTDDSTSQRGVYRANMGQLEMPAAAAGSLCGSLVNGATYATCQGYDLVGAPAGWNANVLFSGSGLCTYDGGDSGSYTCPDGSGGPTYSYSYVGPGFISYGSSPVDAYGTTLTVNGPGWVAGRTACPPAYVLTQTSSVNILGDYKYAHSCVKT
jgi:hypothetical protein